MPVYTLEEFSKLTGLHKQTLRDYDDILQPLRTPGGHRRYTDEHLRKLYQLGKLEQSRYECVIYARISTPAQKEDLQRQVEALKSYAAAKGWKVDKIIEDIGSSINFERKGIRELLQSLIYFRPKYLLIATRDRLAKIGFGIFKHLCDILGVELHILYEDVKADNYDPIQKTVEELLHIIHLYVMKLYGMRSYKKLKDCVMQLLQEGDCYDEKDSINSDSENQR